MATIVRKDGTQFVIEAYREPLSEKKRALLSNEIKQLAEQHGQYVRLFGYANGEMEAVFSKDPGYLFAETIWYYFDKVDNLIYVEAAVDNKSYLVVVRNGCIYVDTVIANDKLRDELMPLTMGREVYHIITAGDVPLAQTTVAPKFSFPEQLVESFDQLMVSPLLALPVIKNLRLLMLSEALRNKQLTGFHFLLPPVAVVSVLMLCGWWLFHPREEVTTRVLPHVVHHIKPNSAFSREMASAEPAHQLVEAVNHINQLYFVPGWHVVKISFDNQQYVVDMVSQGGDLAILSRWARENNYSFSITSNGVKLTRRTTAQVRNQPPHRYDLQRMLTALIDELDVLLHDKAIEIGQIQYFGGMKHTNLTINLNNVSPDVLDLVSRELEALPIKLSGLEIQLQSGLMKGAIQLSVWGT